jgi:hypothetical protein
MGGGGKAQTVGYKYYLGVHMIVCHGPIDSVDAITVDDKLAWSGTNTGATDIFVSKPTLFGGDDSEGGVSGPVTVCMGGPAQVFNPYLRQKIGTDIPAYRKVMGFVLKHCYMGNNPYLKRWAFRGTRINVRQDGIPQWYIAKANVLGDMNPAHIVRECLTDPDWGMGYGELDCDDTAFMAAADRLYAEGMGMSLLWDKQQILSDFISTVLKHIDGSLYVDRKTGKFVLKLARDDYNVNTIPSLDETVIQKVTNFKRTTIAELSNTATVQFWNKSTGKDDSITVKDIALVAQQGCTIGTTFQYPGFTRPDLATRIAERNLRAVSIPTASCQLYVNRVPTTLNVGDVFKMSWLPYGIEQLVMRVTAMDLGTLDSGLVKITCTEDVFALGTGIFAPPPGSEWTDPIGDPTPVVHRLFQEVPYYLIARNLGDAQAQALLATQTYVMVAGANPGNGARSADVYIDDNGTGYAQQNVMDFSPGAVLNGAIGPGDEVLAIELGDTLDSVLPGYIGCFGDYADGNQREYFSVVSCTETTLTCKRGIFDTVPRLQLDGTYITFLGTSAGENLADVGTEFATGETARAKLLTNTGKGQLDISAAPADVLVMVGRLGRPYPPGNYQIDALAYPTVRYDTVAVTWAHRDRTQQTGATPTYQSAGSIGPEAGTTYTVQLYVDGVLSSTTPGLTGTTLSLAPPAGSGGKQVRIDVGSVRGGLTSLMAQSWTYLNNAYLMAESSDYLNTEDDNRIILE